MKTTALSGVDAPAEFAAYCELSATRTLERKSGIYHFDGDDVMDGLTEEWVANAPKSIDDLNDDMDIQLYDADKTTGAKINALGFGNVNFSRSDKVTIVEYGQTGSIWIKGRRLKFGIGARMMLEIKKRYFSLGAKIASPTQVAASVIFGKVDVSYSIKTFGIVGPLTTNLVSAGALHEDTYQNFLNQVGKLIGEAYRNNKQVRITPQPLPYHPDNLKDIYGN